MAKLPLDEQQAIMQEPCQGCFYFSGWNCDYILMEKKRRPCRPGEECTVRKKRGTSREESLVVVSRARSQLPPKPAPKRDSKPYTVQVKHPRPVMNSEPVKRTVFDQAEKPKPKKATKPSPKSAWEIIFSKLETPEIIRLYEKGETDAAIGKVVGCCANSVRKWRIATERPVRSRVAPKQGMRILFDQLESIRADLAQNKTDYELSLKYGVSQRTFGRFRVKHNLGPARGKRKEENL